MLSLVKNILSKFKQCQYCLDLQGLQTSKQKCSRTKSECKQVAHEENDRDSVDISDVFYFLGDVHNCVK